MRGRDPGTKPPWAGPTGEVFREVHGDLASYDPLGPEGPDSRHDDVLIQVANDTHRLTVDVVSETRDLRHPGRRSSGHPRDGPDRRPGVQCRNRPDCHRRRLGRSLAELVLEHPRHDHAPAAQRGNRDKRTSPSRGTFCAGIPRRRNDQSHLGDHHSECPATSSTIKPPRSA